MSKIVKPVSEKPDRWQVGDALEYMDSEDGKVYSGIVTQAGRYGFRVKWDDGYSDTIFACNDDGRLACIRKLC